MLSGARSSSADSSRTGSATSSAGPRDGELLVGLITSGVLDGHLGRLQAAIGRRQLERRGEAARLAAAQLVVGDRVMIALTMRPLYLRGATGTVTGWAGPNVVVQLDAPTGRFSTGELRCPPLGLVRLSGEG